jgi:hypothetical protein
LEVPVRLAEGDWAPAQELLHDFVVERTLGEGGMGKVYLLRSRSTGSRFDLFLGGTANPEGVRQSDGQSRSPQRR